MALDKNKMLPTGQHNKILIFFNVNIDDIYDTEQFTYCHSIDAVQKIAHA